MGRPSDKEHAHAAQHSPADDGRPGRVVVDNRGRNVWQWAKSALDSTTVLLKRLENSELALEPTQRVPVASGAAKSESPSPVRGKPVTKPVDGRSAPKAGQAATSGTRRVADSGGGFDPYNSR